MKKNPSLHPSHPPSLPPFPPPRPSLPQATFCLDILGVKKNPSSPMYTTLGVITKGTVIEVRREGGREGGRECLRRGRGENMTREQADKGELRGGRDEE